MDNDFDRAGFVRADYRLFAPYAVWKKREIAFASWQIVTENVLPEQREDLFDYPIISRVPLVRSRYPRCIPTKEQTSAVNGCKAAEAALKTSVYEMMEAGRVLVALQKKLDGKLFALRADLVPTVIFGSDHAMHGGEKYFYYLKDCVGRPLDQAAQIYGSQKLVGELRRLVIKGAPDRLGIGMNASRHSDYAVRFYEIMHTLKAELLDKLRAGKLVARDAEGDVPREWWEGVDPTTEISIWRPGTLVRGEVATEESEGQNAPPRANNREKLNSGPEPKYAPAIEHAFSYYLSHPNCSRAKAMEVSYPLIDGTATDDSKRRRMSQLISEMGGWPKRAKK